MDILMNREGGAPHSCWFGEKISSLGNLESRDTKQLVPTLFIFHRGKAYSGFDPLMQSWPHAGLRSVISRMNAFHQDRTNARSFLYMTDLINKRLGSVASAPLNDLSSLPYLGKFEQIVLLWPDGNGMGWFDIERQIFREKNTNTAVYVLNGRNRLFELHRTLWRRYRLKRFLEKSFLLEFGVLGVFLVTAPALALWDMACGATRRGK